jgi:hypothetical protein
MQISSTPPEPHHGLHGEWDMFVGPDQTMTKIWLILASVLVQASKAAFGAAVSSSTTSLCWAKIRALPKFPDRKWSHLAAE